MTTKTLVYKVANFHNGISGETLQSLLANALKSKRAALSRTIRIAPSERYSLINYSGPFNKMLVGEFLEYTVGDTQPLAKIDSNADSLELSTLAPPDDGSQFLNGILYFGVVNNSVVLSQSSLLRSKNLELYLNKFLVDAGVFGVGSFVHLADHPPVGSRQKISGAKSIEFCTQLPFTGESVQRGSSIESYSIDGGAWAAFKEFFPPEFQWPQRVPAQEILSGRDLNVKLVVSWSRNKDDDSTEFMDRISNQLRHVDDELDYVIKTRSGKITKDDIKLKTAISLSTNSSGMINNSEMWRKMYDWLTILISQERIVHL